MRERTHLYVRLPYRVVALVPTLRTTAGWDDSMAGLMYAEIADAIDAACEGNDPTLALAVEALEHCRTTARGINGGLVVEALAKLRAALSGAPEEGTGNG